MKALKRKAVDDDDSADTVERKKEEQQQKKKVWDKDLKGHGSDEVDIIVKIEEDNEVVGREQSKEVESLKRKLAEKAEEHNHTIEVLQKKYEHMLREQEMSHEAALEMRLEEIEAVFDQEVEALQRKLNDQEAKLKLSNTKIALQDKVLAKQKKFIGELADKFECPVCMEVPRRGPVPVCPNGHFVCSHCVTETCPSCRVVMGEGKSLISQTILENIDHKCRFDDCEEYFPLGDLDEHEASCLHRTVNCPVPDIQCTEKVPLSKLVQHLVASDCCRNGTAPDETLPGWNRINLFSIDMSRKKESWSATMFTFEGETYVIFLSKVESHYYFVPVMLATETECSKYRIEMIIHEREAEALESKVSARFQGNVISIDENKKCMELYGTNHRLMKKIVKKEGEKYKFSLSFKISAQN